MSYQAPLMVGGESSHTKYHRNTIYIDDHTSNPDRDFDDYIFSIKEGQDCFFTGPLDTQSNAPSSATTITVAGTAWTVVQFSQFQLIVNNTHSMDCRWKRDANICSRLVFIKTDLQFFFASWAYCTDVVEDYTVGSPNSNNLPKGIYDVYLQQTNSNNDCNCSAGWIGAGSNARIKLGSSAEYLSWNVNT